MEGSDENIRDKTIESNIKNQSVLNTSVTSTQNLLSSIDKCLDRLKPQDIRDEQVDTDGKRANGKLDAGLSNLSTEQCVEAKFVIKNRNEQTDMNVSDLVNTKVMNEDIESVTEAKMENIDEQNEQEESANFDQSHLENSGKVTNLITSSASPPLFQTNSDNSCLITSGRVSESPLELRSQSFELFSTPDKDIEDKSQKMVCVEQTLSETTSAKSNEVNITSEEIINVSSSQQSDVICVKTKTKRKLSSSNSDNIDDDSSKLSKVSEFTQELSLLNESTVTELNDDKGESKVTELNDGKSESMGTELIGGKSESLVTRMNDDKGESMVTELNDDKGESMVTELNDDKSESMVTELNDGKHESMDQANNDADEDSSQQSYQINYNFSHQPGQITGSWGEFEKKDENFLKGCKWSPDGSCILTNSDDNYLRLFNTPSEIYCGNMDSVPEMKSVLTMKGGETIYDYCWYPLMNSSDPGTCCLISTSKCMPVHMWDAFTGELICSYRSYDQADELIAAHSVSFNLDGTKIYCGFNKTIRVFDVSRPGRDFEKRQTFSNSVGQPGIISCIEHSPVDDKLYAAGSYSRTIGLYYDPQGEMAWSLVGHQGGVTHIKWSPDGTKIYSGGRKDSDILCWDLRNPGKIMFTAVRKVETNQRIYFDLDSTGQYLVSGNQDGCVSVWDVLQLENSTPDPILTFKAHNDTVNGVSLHPSLPVLATSSGQRHFPVLGDSDDSDIDDLTQTADSVDNSLGLWWIG